MVKYWLWLATRRGLGARGAYLVARQFPSPEAAYYAEPAAYEQIEGLRSTEPLLDKSMQEPERILQMCYEKGISIITLQDASYPPRLKAADDPPVVLYCKGVLPDLAGPTVAVVGTRRASLYGLTQARRMGYGISHCGGIVVSGGARGIDAEAMRGALTGGSPVVAVMGCGVDIAYPAENKSLLCDVAEHGCLLSEYPPGTGPRGEFFPVRNRIISGLSLGVLVVEAPEKSGALITANRALEQGRDVFALPVNVGQESGSGNLQLLREGAILVRDAWDLLEEYIPQFPQLLHLHDCSGWSVGPAPQPPQEPKQKKDVDKGKPTHYIDTRNVKNDLSQEERQLITLLEAGSVHIDVLSERMQQPAGCVLALLTMLEIKGLIRRLPGSHYSLAVAEN